VELVVVMLVLCRAAPPLLSGIVELPVDVPD
jgi:hypothetical protein